VTVKHADTASLVLTAIVLLGTTFGASHVFDGSSGFRSANLDESSEVAATAQADLSICQPKSERFLSLTAELSYSTFLSQTGSFTSSKTHLATPEFRRTDIWDRTNTLQPDGPAAGALSGGVELTGLIGIGSGLLALILVICFVMFVIHRRCPAPTGVLRAEDEDEALAEFTWEEQVCEAFNDGVVPMTSANPIATSIWDPSQFAQGLTTRDDDCPFTQFE
jgi:hypothetical protein